jgi:hypothetical protein
MTKLRLEDVSIGYRIAITVAIVLVILFALALFGYLTGGWDTPATAQSLQPPTLSKYEKRIVELDRAAIDNAYSNQITHLFQTWMKDDQDQPRRALTGAKQARSAYERTMDAVVEREKRLQQEQR